VAGIGRYFYTYGGANVITGYCGSGPADSGALADDQDFLTRGSDDSNRIVLAALLSHLA
jgi:hypothetical protein